MKTALLASALILTGFSAWAVTAPSQSECQALFSQASGGSASIPANQANRYVSDVKQADTDGNGQISQTEFLAACQNGLVTIPNL